MLQLLRRQLRTSWTTWTTWTTWMTLARPETLSLTHLLSLVCQVDCSGVYYWCNVWYVFDRVSLRLKPWLSLYIHLSLSLALRSISSDDNYHADGGTCNQNLLY